ncbi:MAG: glutathione binding-like protein, partial [Candidatus Binataceae bacterium]
AGLNDERRAVLESKRKLGYDALGVMELHLKNRAWFVGERYSIADIALYAYTHVADEGGFELSRFAAIQAWLDRVRAQPGHIPITLG